MLVIPYVDEAIAALNKAYVLVGMIDCSTWPDEYNTVRMAGLIKHLHDALVDITTKPAGNMPVTNTETGTVVRQFAVENGKVVS